MHLFVLFFFGLKGFFGNKVTFGETPTRGLPSWIEDPCSFQLH